MNSLPTINFITWLLIGVGSGLVVRIFDSDKYQNDISGTVISAVIGAIIGGILTNKILGIAPAELNFPALVTALGLALVLSVAYNLIFNRQQAHLTHELPIRTTPRLVPVLAVYSDISKNKQNILKSEFFQSIKFPISKSDLLSFAERKKHNLVLINTLEALPNHIYDSLDDIKLKLKNQTGDAISSQTPQTSI